MIITELMKCYAVIYISVTQLFFFLKANINVIKFIDQNHQEIRCRT